MAMAEEKYYLTKFETVMIWVVRIFLCIYPFKVVYDLERNFTKRHPDIKSNIPGDYEWDAWRKYALQLGVLFTIHSLAGRVLSKRFPQNRRLYYISTGLVSLGVIFSPRALVLMILHIAIFFVISLTRRKFMTWSWAIPMLWFINTNSDSQFEMIGINHAVRSITKFTLLMVYLRCIDYSLLVAEQKEMEINVVDYLHYMFYLPLFVNGPIITFKDFTRDCDGVLKCSLNEIVKDLVKCFVYAFGFEGFLVYVYSPTMIDWLEPSLQHQTALHSIAIAWVHVQLFCIKYIIFFRFSGLFAKLDGFQPPKPPKCVSMMSTFVEMWRTFDRGLYVFLRNNIYFPMGGSRKGLFRQILASLVCFTFVGYWHGATRLLLVWGCINWLGIALEALFVLLAKHVVGDDFIKSSRRVKGVFLSFSILSLIFSNFLFLVGFKPAWILWKRLFSSWTDCLVTFLTMYTVSQSIMDVNKVLDCK